MSDDIEMPADEGGCVQSVYPREQDKVKIHCLRDVESFVDRIDTKVNAALDLVAAFKALNFHCHFEERESPRDDQGRPENNGGIGLHGIGDALYEKLSDVSRDLDILDMEIHRYREHRRWIERQNREAAEAHEAERERLRKEREAQLHSNGDQKVSDNEH